MTHRHVTMARYGIMRISILAPQELVSSDKAIMRVRRNILKAARELSKGIEPVLAWTP